MGLTVVFDTNILFSATGWRGKPFQCVEAARTGKIQAVTCVELVKELAEKLESKFAFSVEETSAKLAYYLGFIRVIGIEKRLNVVTRDPDDNVVIECALAGRAQYIVTGDEDLLELKNFQNVEIIRPGEFLKVLENQKAD